MSARNLIIFTLMFFFACCLNARADTPNIQPGEWETTTSMVMEGPFQIPPQEDVTTQCITEQDIEDGMAFVNEDDNCEITHQDIGNDSMSITMVCDTGEGMTSTMTMNMEYDGDSMQG